MYLKIDKDNADKEKTSIFQLSFYNRNILHFQVCFLLKIFHCFGLKKKKLISKTVKLYSTREENDCFIHACVGFAKCLRPQNFRKYHGYKCVRNPDLG